MLSMTCLTPDLTRPTCRVCLQSIQDEEISSIYDLETESNNLHIFEKIEQCSGIKIILHERLPSLICRYCYAFLKVSYKFRTICRNSNDYLQEFVVCKQFKTQQKEKLGEQILNKKHCKSLSKTLTKRACSLPPTLLKNTNVETTADTSANVDCLNGEAYEEMWLDGENIEDVTNSENLQDSVEQMQVIVGKDGKRHDKLNGKNSSQETVINASTPSKTLGISSDGAAIISEKKPFPKERRTKKEKQPHICEICGNIYNRRYALEAHMRRHRSEKPFKCEICGQEFHCNFELTRHIRKHTGARPYKCSYCSRTFGDRSTLIKHERIHRNERPYKCETCGKTFTYSSVLKSHLFTHTGEKPYTCDLCGKCFSRPHHLRAHLETLQHQNDPRSKILIKHIKRAEDGTIQINLENYTHK